MQKISMGSIQEQIDNQSLQLSEKPHSETTGDYDEHQRKLINWFFASMRTQWGVAKYNSQFGEGDDVKFAKRHWGPRIIKYTPDQLKDMLIQADNQRIAGNQAYAWPDPAAILSLVDTAWERRAHKVFNPDIAIENLDARADRLAAGREVLTNLKKLDYRPIIGKRHLTAWESKMLAEEMSWIDHCDKLLATANQRYPENPEMAGVYFSDQRELAIRKYWA